MNFLKRNWLTWVLVLGLALFPFLLTVFTGQPMTEGAPKFWQGMIAQVFILAVYAMSYDLLLGYTGILSFGHAVFFGTGAYTTGILLKHFHWELWQVVIAVIVVAIGQSLFVGALALRVKGTYFAMVTLAFAQMFFILSEATDFKDYTGAEDGLHSIPVPMWMSPTDERTRFYFISLLFCLVMYFVARQVVNSPVGKIMVAVRENEPRAQMIGYNTFIYKLFAVTFSGILASLAGGMNALWNLNANSSMLSVGVTINVLLMTIIGGAGTLVGSMVGAAVLQLLGYWLNATFGPRWPLIFGLVFIAIVLFLPYGIVGTWRARQAEWQTRVLKLLGRT